MRTKFMSSVMVLEKKVMSSKPIPSHRASVSVTIYSEMISDKTVEQEGGFVQMTFLGISNQTCSLVHRGLL